MAFTRSPVRPRYGPLLSDRRNIYPGKRGDNRARLSFFSFTSDKREDLYTVIPTQIRLSDSGEVQADQMVIRWDDAHEELVSLQSLRDNCPCAGCRGETVLLKTYVPTPQPARPGKYKLLNAHQVGSYALGLAWGDGHATGIYTWQHLRSLCECGMCVGRKSGTAPSE